MFALIAAGKSLTEIAGQLSLSLNTVSTYRAHIMEMTTPTTTSKPRFTRCGIIW